MSRYSTQAQNRAFDDIDDPIIAAILAEMEGPSGCVVRPAKMSKLPNAKRSETRLTNAHSDSASSALSSALPSSDAEGTSVIEDTPSPALLPAPRPTRLHRPANTNTPAKYPAIIDPKTGKLKVLRPRRRKVPKRWDELQDTEKAYALHDALAAAGLCYAFTLNLHPRTEAQMRAHPVSASGWLRALRNSGCTLMTDAEQHKLEALPAALPLFRGFKSWVEGPTSRTAEIELNIIARGSSWTPRRDVAERFAVPGHQPFPFGYVAHVTAPKALAVAYFANEHEIIVADPSHLSPVGIEAVPYVQAA